ncbi:hypothetical protein N7491_004584 [Penicillium cf. griseofulvum]|nr:hypothetical protein N7491_004584 [Penicillium cf. griseofulvum]
MMRTQFIEFLLLFLQFTHYGASLVLTDEEEAAFMRPVEAENVITHSTLNPQHAMGAAFADMQGDSPTQYKQGTVDDVLLGCVDYQNITMRVGNLSVVYFQGKVKALPNMEPTIWTLKPYSGSDTPAFQIFHWTPWGNEVSWRTSNYDGAIIDASAHYSDPMQIRYATGAALSPQVLVAHRGRCVRFNQDGNAELGLESYCRPLSVSIVRPVEWRDAATKDKCPATLIKNLIKKVEDEIKEKNNVHATDWKDTLW